MPEPRDPLLKVLTNFNQNTQTATFTQRSQGSSAGASLGVLDPYSSHRGGPAEATRYDRHGWEVRPRGPALGNDPSAGSPTETLLRLLLPLNDRV
jgi:hypothetical protein